MKIWKFVKSCIFTIITPGLAQVIHGNYRKGFWINASAISLLILFYSIQLWCTFSGLIASFVLYVLLIFYSILDSYKSEGYYKRSGRGALHFLLIIIFPLVYWGIELAGKSLSSSHTAVVPTPSMVPTVMVNDYLVIDDDFFVTNEIHPGDIIMFYNEETDNYFLKRIAGVGGDVVSFSDGKIFVNNKDYIKTLPFRFEGVINFPDTSYTIPHGYAFVLGDNLNDSFDSRYFGPVKREYITGKPLYIYWSKDINRIGLKI